MSFIAFKSILNYNLKMIESNKKDEIFKNICHNVLKLEMMKGRGRWTISDLSRASGITRPSIYYYFGKDKSVIIKEAWTLMVDTIFCLSEEDTLGIRERLKQTVDKINKMPYLFVLFFLEKNSNNEIGEIIREGENKLLNLLKANYKQYGKEEILELYIKELGAVAYRSLNESQINSMFPQ